jgi:catechol 2,3-dioxygenase-like lactoylglutathione lyase family enzyme
MIRRVRHIGIVVKKIDDLLPFYRDSLKLRIVKQADEPETFINHLLDLNNCQLKTVKLTTEDGLTLIELLEFTSHQTFEQENREVFTQGLSHIAFTVENLNSLYVKLLGEGIKFISPPLTAPDGLAKVAFCRDPVGTYLELVEELKY